MTSHWQLEIDDAGRPMATSCGFPSRLAAAVAILAALTFVDATPHMGLRSEASERPSAERAMPSACGAEAVARAQREVLGIRLIPTAIA